MRNIEKKLVQWIDAKLAGNGLAQLAIKNKDPRVLFRLAAEACVGVVENGFNSGYLIELLQKTVDGSSDKEPYCMCAVQSWLAYAEVKTGIKSQIYASEHCMTTFNNTPKSCRVKKIPATGAIVIWQKSGTSSGHTGVMLEWADKTMSTCEANTGSTDPREGDGIYYKTRSTVKTGSLKVVGYLKPF